ncbi:hypothetical protein Q7P36_007742 [Cladosporium allicinum]
MEDALRLCIQDTPGHAQHMCIFPIPNGSQVTINRQALINVRIGDHIDQTLYFVTTLHNYDTVLGLSWLEQHNPTLDFNRLCLISVDGWGRTNTALHEHDSADLDICTVSADAFLRISKKKGYETAVLWPEDFSADNEHAQCFAMSPEDYDKFMTNTVKTDPQLKLPLEYHEFADVFKHKSEFTVLPHRPSIDHAINLKPGAKPPYKRGFAMNPTQLAAVKKCVDEGTGNDTVVPSNSPCASLVLLVKKPSGGICVCVDYRALNALTVKDRYPIPLIKETLERLSKAKFYTKLDIVAAFNNLCIREGDEWMTAFITRYGLYQYKVMPFGLCNGPATWQRYMNNTMQAYLDEFVTVYLDDLLIYSATLEEHQAHMQKVLLKLRDANLPVDIDKCEFHVQEVKYLAGVLSQMHVSTTGERDLLRPVAFFKLLSQFNFVITYRPGTQGGKPDALTQHSQDLPADDNDPRLACRRRAILHADNTDAVVRLAALLVDDAPTQDAAPVPAPNANLSGNSFAALADIEDNDDLEGDTIQKEMKDCHDELAAGKVPQFMKTNCIEPSDCAFVKGMLMVNGRLYILEYLNLRTRCIQEHHDQPLAGHQGIGRTFELVSRMQQGTLASNPVLTNAWKEIAVDFIVELPTSKSSLNHREYRNILTITDRLTKMVYFLPTDDLTPEYTARLFYERVFTQHGLPSVITSDRGSYILPFFANYGRHPRMSFLQDLLQLAGTTQRTLMDDTDTFAKHMEDVLTEMQAAASLANTKQTHYVLGAPALNIRTLRPSKKLDHKNEGPFEVIAPVGRRSYKLKLLPLMKIFNTFHTSLLRPIANDLLPGQRIPSPPPIEVEREGVTQTEYDVNAVIDLRRKGRGKHPGMGTIYCIDHIDNALNYNRKGSKEAIALFHKNNLLKPGPPAAFKDKLELHMMGLGEPPHAVTAEAAPAIKVRSYTQAAAHTELTRHTDATDRPCRPLNAAVRACAIMEQQQLKLPVITVAEGDLWLLDVTGAPYWEGGSNVTK